MLASGPTQPGPGGAGGTGSPAPREEAPDAGVEPPSTLFSCFPAEVPAEAVAGEPAIPELRLTPLATNLEQPIYVSAAPGDESRLFVIEKPGRIRVIRDGQLQDEPFLDLTDRVATTVEEMGLLGLAFHPKYKENGLFYLTYSSDPEAGNVNPAHTEVLAEFHVRPGDPDHAAGDERRLLGIAKPEGNHNGGNLQFRADGYLYMGVGDGGGANDEHGEGGNGQALNSLMGKMLRLDVDARSSENGQYGIPAGNYAELAAGALPEIWSIGLRNPWRFSFDACSGDLFIGDVGQEGREEVDYVPAAEVTGRNFGWRVMEAELCFNPEAGCDAAAQNLTLPIASYPRSLGQSIIGGYVYRGSALPALRGTYLYADYETAFFFALRVQAGALSAAPVDISANVNAGRVATRITSFGQDNRGELYVTTFTGNVFRLDPR